VENVPPNGMFLGILLRIFRFESLADVGEALGMFAFPRRSLQVPAPNVADPVICAAMKGHIQGRDSRDSVNAPSWVKQKIAVLISYHNSRRGYVRSDWSTFDV